MTETFLSTINCAVCSNPFTVQRSRLRYGRGKHCSPACQYVARRQAPKTAIPFTCIGCGANFTRAKSTVAGGRGSGKYCTRACRDLHWVGPNNPNWQNGDKVYKRGSRWHSIRRSVIARDKVCKHCGDDGPMHVHHKIPFRVFGDKEVANQASNLVALCPPCHRKEDARTKWVSFSEGALCFSADSEMWQLARSKGMV